MRHDGRKNDQLRAINIQPDFIVHPEGSVLITFGQTRVICNATVEEKIPSFLRGQNKGWIQAEYAMLPQATHQRTSRESHKGKVTGRTMEIQRLIGRALRSVIDLEKLGERTITVDCDVIQADGGTRIASINGAFIAIAIVMKKLLTAGVIEQNPLKDYLAAVSVGISKSGEVLLDLDYTEDSTCQVDMNIVMTGKGHFVELQGTGEEATFSFEQLQDLLALGAAGIAQLIELHQKVINDYEVSVIL